MATTTVQMHRVVGIAGRITLFPATGSHPEFYCMALTVMQEDGQEINIDLFSHDASCLQVQK